MATSLHKQGNSKLHLSGTSALGTSVMGTSMSKPKLGTSMLGTSMLEVLIAIFIFSIGLIGIAKLQVVAKKSNYDAVQRMTATSLTNEIIERMRSNPTVLNSYTGGATTTIGRASLGTEPTPRCLPQRVVSGTTVSAEPCTSAQMATHDLWYLEQILDGVTEQVASSSTYAGGLNQPTACISGPAGGISGAYTVAIAWHGKTALSNPTINTCGQGLGLYGANDEFRRVLVVETFIFNQM